MIRARYEGGGDRSLFLRVPNQDEPGVIREVDPELLPQLTQGKRVQSGHFLWAGLKMELGKMALISDTGCVTGLERGSRFA